MRRPRERAVSHYFALPKSSTVDPCPSFLGTDA